MIWRAASTCCDCRATSNGGNRGGDNFFLSSSFVTTPPSVAVDKKQDTNNSTNKWLHGHITNHFTACDTYLITISKTKTLQQALGIRADRLRLYLPSQDYVSTWLRVYMLTYLNVWMFACFMLTWLMLTCLHAYRQLVLLKPKHTMTLLNHC